MRNANGKTSSCLKLIRAALVMSVTVVLLASTVQAFPRGPNVALGKTAKADTSWNGWVASYATDGTDNFWNGGDSSQHWLEVDLGQSYSLSHVDLSYPAEYGGVIFNLFSSTNNDAWNEAWSDNTNWTFIGSGALSVFHPESIATNGTAAQYLKYEVFSAGDWVGLTEIAAYGTAAAVPEPSTFLLLGAGLGGLALLRRNSGKQ